MDVNILRLIKTVNDNKANIQDLESLAELLDHNHADICLTTINGHYNYKMYGDKHKDPSRHIDAYLKENASEVFNEMEKYNYKEKYYYQLDLMHQENNKE